MILIGLVIVAAIIIVSLILAAVSTASSEPAAATSGFQPGNSGYTATISPTQRAVIEVLVYKVAPLVKGTNYSKASIERMVGTHPAFDQVMYFYFRKQLSDGTLSVGNMVKAVREGMTD
jgi:hypothetical protein